jgi:hypothetical protein
MTEAIFGLIGVVIGSALTWLQTYWINKRTDSKNARYLAIRIICILDKYVEDCADVIKDDGLSFGERDKDGCLKPQVKAPGPPVFPDDVDWKAIDPDLMYILLSMPSEVEAGDRMIKFTENIAGPPDYEEWFEERRFYYSHFGLTAHRLSGELSSKYKVPKKVYNDWNPVADLEHELNEAKRGRQKRITEYQLFVNKVLPRD